MPNRRKSSGSSISQRRKRSTSRAPLTSGSSGVGCAWSTRSSCCHRLSGCPFRVLVLSFSAPRFPPKFSMAALAAFGFFASDAHATEVPEPYTFGGGSVTWDADLNRIIVKLPDGELTREDRQRRSERMKSRGFVWSGTQGAFVRKANHRAWLDGKFSLEDLVRAEQDRSERQTWERLATPERARAWKPFVAEAIAYWTSKPSGGRSGLRVVHDGEDRYNITFNGQRLFAPMTAEALYSEVQRNALASLAREADSIRETLLSEA